MSSGSGKKSPRKDEEKDSKKIDDSLEQLLKLKPNVSNPLQTFALKKRILEYIPANRFNNNIKFSLHYNKKDFTFDEYDDRINIKGALTGKILIVAAINLDPRINDAYIDATYKFLKSKIKEGVFVNKKIDHEAYANDNLVEEREDFVELKTTKVQKNSAPAPTIQVAFLFEVNIDKFAEFHDGTDVGRDEYWSAFESADNITDNVVKVILPKAAQLSAIVLRKFRFTASEQYLKNHPDVWTKTLEFTDGEGKKNQKEIETIILKAMQQKWQFHHDKKVVINFVLTNRGKKIYIDKDKKEGVFKF
tara:strand:- start:1708 stop:2622 length:915 start_codon:yes stop_codon:yes gene_type:complete